MNDRIIKLKGNIWKSYLFMFLRIDFTHGFWMIYLYNKGIGLVYLGLLETLFHITSFVMEIPTGIIADVFGRKTSRIFGRLFFVIANIVILLADQWPLIAVGFFITAISYNLESGAGEALLYDSLKELKSESKYIKIIGRIEAIYQITALFSFIIGGLVASINYSWLYILTIIFALIALVESFTFIEPEFKKKAVVDITPYKEFKVLVKESFKVIKTNKKIALFIFSMEFILSIGTILFFYLQNYWKFQDISEFKIGIYFAIGSLMGGIGGLYASKIEKKFGQKRFLIVFPIVTVMSVWFIAMTKLHVISFVVVTFVDSLIYVGLNDYINTEIESNIRATVLSVSSMIFSLYMIILFPIFGYISDIYGFQWAFLFLACISSVALSFNIRMINRTL